MQPGSAASTAIWPFSTSTVRYRDPVHAAKGFAITFLGFVAPVVGPFMQGDARSGEVEVRAERSGPPTTVMVRQLGVEGDWWILGAATADLQLENPAWDTTISSPVTLRGTSTSFEATVDVEIRQDGTLTPLARDTLMGGSNGQMGPFSKPVSFPAATSSSGAIVLRTLSAKDGTVWEASAVRVQFR